MQNIYVLSPSAARDVLKIGLYSTQQWGIDQAETYVSNIKIALQLVADNPNIGRSCDSVRAGYKKYPAGSHIFYYRLINHGIDVIRVLHQNMTPEKHL